MKKRNAKKHSNMIADTNMYIYFEQVLHPIFSFIVIVTVVIIIVAVLVFACNVGFVAVVVAADDDLVFFLQDFSCLAFALHIKRCTHIQTLLQYKAY